MRRNDRDYFSAQFRQLGRVQISIHVVSEDRRVALIPTTRQWRRANSEGHLFYCSTFRRQGYSLSTPPRGASPPPLTWQRRGASERSIARDPAGKTRSR